MEITVKKFIKKVKACAKEKDLFFLYDDKAGKGSHGKLFVGEKSATVI